MDKEKFESLVEKALDQIPDKFKKYLDNIAVIVEEKPSREFYNRKGTTPLSTVLGLYHGVPFPHRGPYYGNTAPDVIVIFQKAIESICATEKQIERKIRDVILHEIGHYFGMSEKELADIEN